jgi:novel protein kinase C epsilon type
VISTIFALFYLSDYFPNSTRSEKRVFLAAARERHPFLLGLHSCFQTETRVYFVMEYVSGGDLMLHIQRKQFSLRQAKFYASEVLLALEYFHANGIIYRCAQSQCSWRAHRLMLLQ